MKKVSGYYDILAVGGVTADNDGSSVPATKENIAEHFPEPTPYVPEVPQLRDDGFLIDIGPDTGFSDDGFLIEKPSHENNAGFIAASAFAKENGLTAVLVKERQDVGPDGAETGRMTLLNKLPEVIYLDAQGNQVEPEGAPESGFGQLFKGLQQSIGEDHGSLLKPQTRDHAALEPPGVFDAWANNAFEISTGNGVPINNMFATAPLIAQADMLGANMNFKATL